MLLSLCLTGAGVAGITFGVLAFITIVAIVAWFFYKRRCKVAFSNPTASSHQELEKARPTEDIPLQFTA